MLSADIRKRSESVPSVNRSSFVGVRCVVSTLVRDRIGDVQCNTRTGVCLVGLRLVRVRGPKMFGNEIV